jgi:hypothetical protein
MMIEFTCHKRNEDTNKYQTGPKGRFAGGIHSTGFLLLLYRIMYFFLK